MLRRLAKQVRWCWDLARFSRRAGAGGAGSPNAVRRVWGPLLAWAGTMRRGARICRAGRFTPAEAFRFGLMQQGIDPANPPPYVSRRNATKLQEALNPPAMAMLARNKGLFYRHCQAAGVPIPALYALFFPGAAACLPDNIWLSPSMIMLETVWLSWFI